jgi:phosphatidylcholine synthase
MLLQSYTSSSTSASRMNLFSAWLVHLYTASGAVTAFFGAIAVFGGRYREALLWMVAATFIDATDGILARRARVKTILPSFDGGRLDDIVDYLTFVFLPVLFLYYAGTLPDRWGAAVAVAILISSAYGFASADAKTEDHFFTGFPSYWNIVAVYAYLGRLTGVLTPAVNAVMLLVLCGMVFWRVRYVYPSRTPTLRTLTWTLGGVWAVMVLAMILSLPEVHGPLVLASLVFPAYYFVLSAALQVRRRAAISAQS